MAPSREDALLGRIVLHNKLASEAQVKEALAAAGREGKPLGDILRAEGILSEKQLQAANVHVQKRLSDQNAGAGAATSATPGASPGGIGRVIPASEVAQKEFGRFAGQPLPELLQEVRQLGASDLHCQVGSPPYVRIHGSQVFLRHPPYEAKELERQILGVLGDYERGILEDRWDVDFCLEFEHGRYRTSVFRQRLGTDVVFRIIPRQIPTLKELHLPQYLDRFTKYSQGIVLITGPAGCGKSATMAALVDIVNQDRRDHIVAVEDPIEYVFESKGCNVNQRQVKIHTENFATALRSALRADPDVIVIGEMRDLETVSSPSRQLKQVTSCWRPSIRRRPSVRWIVLSMCFRPRSRSRSGQWSPSRCGASSPSSSFPARTAWGGSLRWRSCSPLLPWQT